MKVKVDYLFNLIMEKSSSFHIFKKRGLKPSATQGIRNYSIKVIYEN